MPGIFPDWYGAATTLNASSTVVSATDSKISVNRRGNRRYLKLINLGPNPSYINIGSQIPVIPTKGIRLGANDSFELSIPNGNIMYDSVSVLSSVSATTQRLHKIEVF